MIRVSFLVVLFALVTVLAEAPARAATNAFKELPRERQQMLDEVERRTFDYFIASSNAENGQVADHWPQRPNSNYFSSIAAIGFGLTSYGIGAERGWITRADAAKRTLATLRFFHDAPQSDAPDASGDHGFFYHFLDMNTGRRYHAAAFVVELSSVDTAELMAGVLFAMSYFDRGTADEVEIRKLADEVYRRVDWRWFTDGNPLIEGGWTPEHDFDYNYYRGFSEAFILYIIALGSPTHGLTSASWKRWTETYDRTWGEFQGQTHLGGGPTFWHQFAQSWIDFRGIQDDYMRTKGIDYFTNSQRAALSQREYAIHNPTQWKDYGANVWGLTACNGPRGATPPGEPDRYISDPKLYYGYMARGVGIGYNIDDGTIAPTAGIASLPFVPELVVHLIEELQRRYGENVYTRYGFVDAFNPTFTFTDRPLRTGRVVPNVGWFDTEYISIDQGPILLMLENYRSEFVWNVMRRNAYLREGLKRAGFTGGWLDRDEKK